MAELLITELITCYLVLILFIRTREPTEEMMTKCKTISGFLGSSTFASDVTIPLKATDKSHVWYTFYK